MVLLVFFTMYADMTRAISEWEIVANMPRGQAKIAFIFSAGILVAFDEWAF